MGRNVRLIGEAILDASGVGGGGMMAENLNTAALQVIEECGELIHAICKAERFGYRGLA